MIEFDFTFLQPKTISEALQTYRNYSNQGKKVLYFSGGTEFISRSRHGETDTEVVIDVKQITDCQEYGVKGEKLIIGSGITLSTLTDHETFPLLSTVARSIATRTARNKITVGGNLCSHLPYKEAYLPFLLADSTAVIATESGTVTWPIAELPELADDEFLVQIITDKELMKMPYSHKKRTRQSRINYPIVTMAMMEVNQYLRVATSGLIEEPLRSKEMEEIIYLKEGTSAELSEMCLEIISEDVMDDALATKEYRGFVFKTLLQQVLDERKKSI